MERVDANLVPFAQNNSSGYRFAFGTDTATDDINANYNDNIKKGWGTTPNEFPEVEDFNAMAYTSSYLIAYLYQMGISEWNNKQKYKKYSRVIGSDGIVYKAKEGTDLAPNVNNNPTTDTTNWEVDTQFDINSLVAKTTPDDTDNFAIQETGGDLKKLSFANLKLSLFNPTLTSNATLTGIDNKIVMNGIATSLGLEIGDVVQFTSVADSNNQKLRTVESIVNDNEIIVNYEHCGSRGNGALKLTDETLINATIKRIAKYYNAPLGLGQALVPVTRVANTNYYAPYLRPIGILPYFGSSGGGSHIIKINGIASFSASFVVTGVATTPFFESAQMMSYSFSSTGSGYLVNVSEIR